MASTPFFSPIFIFILIQACAAAIPENHNHTHYFEHVKAMDDWAFETKELFYSVARSKSECARICVNIARPRTCLTFTFRRTYYAGGVKNCRGFAYWATSRNVQLSFTFFGSKTYRRRLDVKSTWLEKDCTLNNNCPIPHSQCFMQRCVCTPGFYYSITRDACIADCMQVDPFGRFQRYPDSFMNGETLLQERPVPYKKEKDCLKHCAAHPECMSIDFDQRLITSECFLSPSTALTEPMKWTVRFGLQIDHFQIYCV